MTSPTLPPIFTRITDDPFVRRGKALDIVIDATTVDLDSQLRQPYPPDTEVLVWLSATPHGVALDPSAVIALERGDQHARRDYRRNWFGTIARLAVEVALSGLSNGDAVHIVVSIDGETDSIEKEVAD